MQRTMCKSMCLNHFHVPSMLLLRSAQKTHRHDITMDNALLYMAGVLVVSGGWPWPDHAVLYAFYGVGSVINLQHGWHENRKFTEKQLIYYYYETQGRTKLRTNAITLRNVMLSAALSWSFPLFWSEWQQRRSKPRVLSESVWKPVGCKLSPRFGKF